jgi:hypothetical protein
MTRCHMCGTWVATNIIGSFIVCDKARCQDEAKGYVEIDQILKEGKTMDVYAVNQHRKSMGLLPLEDVVIKVGNRVQEAGGGEYLGKVTSIESIVMYAIEVPASMGGNWNITREASQIELAKELTELEAWTELPILVLKELQSFTTVWGTVVVSEQRSIRHDCYVLLGGAHIKITEEVKARVRKVVADVASALGIFLV